MFRVTNRRKEREVSKLEASFHLDVCDPPLVYVAQLQRETIDRSSVRLHNYYKRRQKVLTEKKKKKKLSKTQIGTFFGINRIPSCCTSASRCSWLGWKTRNRLLRMTADYLHVPSRPLYSPGTFNEGGNGQRRDTSRGVSRGLEASQFRTSNTRKQANSSPSQF